MGDRNQLTYLMDHVGRVSGPILEIGSKDYGSTQDFRGFLAAGEYVGLDMEPGKGVDVVHDLTLGTGSLPLRHFNLVICCSVMEHVNRPWFFADNVTELVCPGGLLYISVPWVWRFHGYPDDYFRFSWRGIEQLYPAFDWTHILYSTNVAGEFFEAVPEADNKRAFFKTLTTPTGVQQRKYLPYLALHMIGRKRE